MDSIIKENGDLSAKLPKQMNRACSGPFDLESRAQIRSAKRVAGAGHCHLASAAAAGQRNAGRGFPWPKPRHKVSRSLRESRGNFLRLTWTSGWCDRSWRCGGVARTSASLARGGSVG